MFIDKYKNEALSLKTKFLSESISIGKNYQSYNYDFDSLSSNSEQFKTTWNDSIPIDSFENSPNHSNIFSEKPLWIRCTLPNKFETLKFLFDSYKLSTNKDSIKHQFALRLPESFSQCFIEIISDSTIIYQNWDFRQLLRQIVTEEKLIILDKNIQYQNTCSEIISIIDSLKCSITTIELFASIYRSSQNSYCDSLPQPDSCNIWSKIPKIFYLLQNAEEYQAKFENAKPLLDALYTQFVEDFSITIKIDNPYKDIIKEKDFVQLSTIPFEKKEKPEINSDIFDEFGDEYNFFNFEGTISFWFTLVFAMIFLTYLLITNFFLHRSYGDNSEFSEIFQYSKNLFSVTVVFFIIVVLSYFPRKFLSASYFHSDIYDWIFVITTSITILLFYIITYKAIIERTERFIAKILLLGVLVILIYAGLINIFPGHIKIIYVLLLLINYIVLLLLFRLMNRFFTQGQFKFLRRKIKFEFRDTLNRIPQYIIGFVGRTFCSAGRQPITVWMIFFLISQLLLINHLILTSLNINFERIDYWQIIFSREEYSEIYLAIAILILFFILLFLLPAFLGVLFGTRCKKCGTNKKTNDHIKRLSDVLEYLQFPIKNFSNLKNKEYLSKVDKEKKKETCELLDYLFRINIDDFTVIMDQILAGFSFIENSNDSNKAEREIGYMLSKIKTDISSFMFLGKIKNIINFVLRSRHKEKITELFKNLEIGNQCNPEESIKATKEQLINDLERLGYNISDIKKVTEVVSEYSCFLTENCVPENAIPQNLTDLINDLAKIENKLSCWKENNDDDEFRPDFIKIFYDVFSIRESSFSALLVIILLNAYKPKHVSKDPVSTFFDHLHKLSNEWAWKGDLLAYYDELYLDRDRRLNSEYNNSGLVLDVFYEVFDTLFPADEIAPLDDIFTED